MHGGMSLAAGARAALVERPSNPKGWWTLVELIEEDWKS
jgi:cytochrome c-type biogenesis protein CcmH/NrfG